MFKEVFKRSKLNLKYRSKYRALFPEVKNMQFCRRKVQRKNREKPERETKEKRKRKRERERTKEKENKEKEKRKKRERIKRE